MGDISFHQILLIFALGGFVYLVYLRGKRKNQHIISFIARELEEGINPLNKLYKNLGASIGYKALYQRNGYINKVVTIFTTLPRHSIAVYPFHVLFGDHDKLQINAYSEKDIAPHFILLKKKKRYEGLLKKYHTEGLSLQEQEYKGERFMIYYRDTYSRNVCDSLLQNIDSPYLISIAANPENNAFHLYCIPKEGKIEPMVRTFLSSVKNYLQKGK